MVMRKFIFFSIQVLFLCLVSMQSYAVTVEECSNATTQEACPAGCKWDGSGCRICSAGTYSSAAGSESCASCNIKPNGGEFLTDEQYAGQTSNTCPWTAQCAGNQYWVPSGDNFGCATCSGGYEEKEGSSSFEVSGSGKIPDVGSAQELLNWLAAHTEVNRCEAKVFTLDLQKNTLWVITGEGTYENKTATAKYETGFAFENETNWKDNPDGLPEKALQPNKPIKTFKGYSTSESSCTNMYFGADGKFLQGWDIFLGKDNIKLYACYENLDVVIKYYGKDGEEKKTVNFRVNDRSEVNDYKAEEYNEDEWGIDPGNLFDHYACTYEGGQSCGDIKPGDSVPLGSTGINLKPVFTACKQGWFCSGGNSSPCPSGTTSDPGAASDADCYMKAGDGGTKFCDGTGKCFYLPGNGKIPKNPSSDTTQNSAQSSTQNSAQ